jgi:alanyl-tRNA synthetase
LLQEVENIYEIDQIRPLIDLASQLSGKKYGALEIDDVRMRVIADHIRSSLMLMSDGVTASNEGRGYVLRRLLRRSIRALRLLGVTESSFERLFTVSKDAMVEAYPELEENFPRILRSALSEETGFARTLETGTLVLEQAIAAANGILSGATAFELHDTYGFPIDLTVEIAAESGLEVNREGFIELMDQQKQRAKQDAKDKKMGGGSLQVYSEVRSQGETLFTGYDSLEGTATIIGLVRDGVSVKTLSQGQIGEVFLNSTSLYGESGGQAADAGTITGDGFTLDVLDVQKPVKGLFAHRVKVSFGEVAVNSAATTIVDAHWRLGACQSHSATHVVHAAIRQVLGPQALQSGSYNRPGYMRLDFAWGESLSEATKSEIEEVSNLAIRSDLSVTAQFMSVAAAKEFGAIALFGETYDEQVRVVQVGGPWSRELCGGTHVSRTAQIGLVSLVSEASVGSGSRRIEALVGMEALSSLQAERDLVKRLALQLKAPASEVESRVSESLAELKASSKIVSDMELAKLQTQIPTLARAATSVNGIDLLSLEVDISDSDQLRTLAMGLKSHLGAASIVILGSKASGAAVVIVVAGPASVTKGYKAGELVSVASKVLGGGGGGKPELAQGGGTNVEKLAQAIAAAAAMV